MWRGLLGAVLEGSLAWVLLGGFVEEGSEVVVELGWFLNDLNTCLVWEGVVEIDRGGYGWLEGMRGGLPWFCILKTGFWDRGRGF